MKNRPKNAGLAQQKGSCPSISAQNAEAGKRHSKALHLLLIG